MTAATTIALPALPLYALPAIGAVWPGQGGSSAWCQNFSNGYQNNSHKDNTLRCRAVRSFILQSFDPSAAVA